MKYLPDTAGMKVIILALIPIVIDVAQIFIEKAFFPEILEHTVARIPLDLGNSVIKGDQSLCMIKILFA